MAAKPGRAGPLLLVAQMVLAALVVVSVGYIALDISINMLFGCPPGDSQSVGPEAQLSLLPPGVTCTYDLGAESGLLVVGPSFFPALLAVASLAGIFVIRRLARLGDPWRADLPTDANLSS